VSRGRDWYDEAGRIASAFPGLGDPFRLDIEDFNRFARAAVKRTRQAGPVDPERFDHRAYVEEQMRRLHG
jgi:hypothetical protein